MCPYFQYCFPEWIFNFSFQVRMEDRHTGGCISQVSCILCLLHSWYVYLELHVSHLRLFMALLLRGFKPRPLTPVSSPGQLLCMFQRHYYIPVFSCRVYQHRNCTLINILELQLKSLRRHYSLSFVQLDPQVEHNPKSAFYCTWPVHYCT